MISKTIDPDGRRVVLTEERWRHIKDRHADLSRHLREIMRAVREPDRRFPGRSASEEYFYLEAAGPSPWLEVVVHYKGGGGWIATAFRRESLPRR